MNRSAMWLILALATSVALVTTCMLPAQLVWAQEKKSGENVEQQIKNLTEEMAQAQQKGDA